MTPLEAVSDESYNLPRISRIYDSLTGLQEGLAAMKVLNLRDITVTTVYQRAHTTDHAHVPGRLRYYLDAKEVGR